MNTDTETTWADSLYPVHTSHYIYSQRLAFENMPKSWARPK